MESVLSFPPTPPPTPLLTRPFPCSCLCPSIVLSNSSSVASSVFPFISSHSFFSFLTSFHHSCLLFFCLYSLSPYFLDGPSTIQLSVCLFIHLLFNQSVNPSVCLSVHQSVCPSTLPSIHMFVISLFLPYTVYFQKISIPPPQKGFYPRIPQSPGNSNSAL